MTANPAKPARYRPGKGPGENADPSDSEEEEEEEEDEVDEEQKQQGRPTSRSTPAQPIAKRITGTLRDINLDDRRAQAAATEAARLKAEAEAHAREEEGFETEESSDEGSDEDESNSDVESSDEESSSDEPAKPLLRPTFIRKTARKDSTTASASPPKIQPFSVPKRKRAARTKPMR